MMIYALLTAYYIYLLLIPCRRHIHMLQQLSYRPERYLNWYRHNLGRLFRLLLPAQKQKLPLKYTARVKRLYILSALLTAAYTVVVGLVIKSAPWNIALLLYGFLFAADLVFLANLLLLPLEKRIASHYVAQAARLLEAMPELKRIGITGSYGKTSVKQIAASLLAEKYRLLATPGSYNTPLGITRVIRGELRPVHELLLAEMGARQPGDIAELCSLVRPEIGVLTAIGEQHLQTFGSVENIARTKWELINALPETGAAIVNGDDAMIRKRLHNAACTVITYGFGPENDFWADDLQYAGQGSSFTLHHGKEELRFETALLGRHNVANILAALAICHHLGIEPAPLKRAVRQLRPAEHRLQLRQSGNCTIIDDAYNANPEGAAIALEVLDAMPGGQKIVITPGLVELGGREHELNFALGQQLAKADQVILVGKKQSLPLKEGLASAGFSPERLYIAADLDEARQRLAAILRAGDVVLYENDLPDLYDE